MKSLWQRLSQKKSISAFALHDSSENPHATGEGFLHRTLGVWDLTALGIAAVIGAGIFSTIGNASYDGGPAVVFLFIFTAIACGFSALCYAEFASILPISGSAYTYAYASFGELFAWIIGWDLIMEYAIGNIAVAISWSDYFTGFLEGYGIHFPTFLSMDFLSAHRGHEKISEFLAQGGALAEAADKVSSSALGGYQAWEAAPRFFGIPLICDLPALAITVFVTWVVYLGIRESKRMSNLMVALKLLVILMVMSPFAPNGISGVMKGVSAVFFAYIGFDAISTTAEECKNPQRDLPRGMLYSLLICTLLYVLISLVLTGIMSYKELQVGDPLAFVFGPKGANLPWVSGIVALSAVVAMTGVLLVFQIGQPRIWMSMSRDGLLPPIFGRLHPLYKTPSFSTWVTGAVVAIPSLFMNLTEVTDLTSIGTLFAFILVCGGVLVLETHYPNQSRGFKIPYWNSKYLLPLLTLASLFAAYAWNPEAMNQFLTYGSWETFQHKIPLIFYSLGMLYLNALAFKKELSLIPCLGLASCGYLMTELGILNWIRFLIWLAVGLLIYFSYGFRHSKLNTSHLDTSTGA
jgi:APA family basic amino acid/polyamine antiporter